MAFDLAGSPAYSTTTPAYGTHCLSGGEPKTSGIVPSNLIFTFEAKVRRTGTGLSVAAGCGGAWMGSAAFAQAVYGSVDLTSSIAINDGNWHHLALVVNGDAGGQLWVDGVLGASSTTAASTAGVVTTGDFAFRGLGGSAGSFIWPGEIDEGAFWSDAHYASTFTPGPVSDSAANLLAVYHFDNSLVNSKSAASAPGAPTIGTATAGNAQAAVAFTAPASDGGSAITGYTVTSSPGGLTATGASSPLTVTGLTNGTAYTFTAHATNAIGNSAESAASNSVTPTSGATAPGAPTIGTATRGNGQASVAFTAPASNGGSAITGYTVTSSPGGFTGTGSASPIAVAGLTNGTAYTFTATATNAVGVSSPSAASNSVTPATVPGAPTIGAATAGSSQATVAFSAPASNGGSAITGYTVTSSPGGLTATGASSPLTVTGLTNGTAYTFTAKATNTVGDSAASAASNSVTPTAALYTRVDSTDPVTGQSIMVLVPSSSSAVPYNAANPTGVVIYTHGVGQTVSSLLDEPLNTGCVDALLNAGYILAASASSDFGNQLSCDATAGLAKYLRANYNVKGIGIWAVSMGGLTGALAVAQNKIKGVVGFLATYPILNLDTAYSGVGGGTAWGGSINAAYGITGTGNSTFTNKTNGHDPCLMDATAFKHVPMRFYASAADAVVKKAVNTDVFQPIIRGSCRESAVVVCTGTHGDPSHFVPAEYVAFFDRCFASMVATAGLITAEQPTTTKTVTITFENRAGVLQANLTGLKWEWSDVSGQVIDSGTGETTDASGVFSTTVHTNLAAAGVGYLKVFNTAGAVNTTDIAFFGPVTVA